MTDTSLPAYPSTDSLHTTFHGMSIRQRAAIAAMQGMCANPSMSGGWGMFATEAVKAADALLRELAKEESK